MRDERRFPAIDREVVEAPGCVLLAEAQELWRRRLVQAVACRRMRRRVQASGCCSHWLLMEPRCRLKKGREMVRRGLGLQQGPPSKIKVTKCDRGRAAPRRDSTRGSVRQPL